MNRILYSVDLYIHRHHSAHLGILRDFRAQRVPKVPNTGLSSLFLHQPAVRDMGTLALRCTFSSV
jgi:hypothetical protein